MNYKYFFVNQPGLVGELEVDPANVAAGDFQGNAKILVKNEEGVVLGSARDVIQFDTFRQSENLDILDNEFEHIEAVEPPPKDHINPAHYAEYLVITHGSLDGAIIIQWLEAQQFKPYWRANPRSFVQAVLMQADKYLSRMGMKDEEAQEMQKALWYTKFATAFMLNGYQPILVREIEFILDPDQALIKRFIKVINVEEEGMLGAGFTQAEIDRIAKYRNA